jgi:transcriptional regulator with XRE-family HTH domain
MEITMMAKTDAAFDPKMIEAEENLLIDYQFLLQERMTQKGVSQSQLAERAGISKARLSQVLSDNANPTVKTFADLFHALGERVYVTSVPVLEAVSGREAAVLSQWEWAKTEHIVKPISEAMVALMTRSPLVVEEGSMASNDNYSPGCRVAYFESEVAAAVILEAELEPEAA